MASTLKTSPAGRRLIKSFEGFRRRSAPLPGGGWVIGYGHTKSARADVTISEDDADKLLIYDLMKIEAAIGDHVARPLTQNQFDALASLVLNIGADSFLNSAVLARLNAGHSLGAAVAFEQWRCAVVDGRAVVVDGLARRRAVEKALFLTPADGPVPAPSPEVPVIADGAPSLLGFPVVAYRPDLNGAGGVYELLHDADTAAEEPTPAPEPLPEPVLEPVPEPLAETGVQPAFAPFVPEPQDEDEAPLPRAEAAIADDEDTEEVFVFEAVSEPEIEPEPEPEPAFAPEPEIEAAFEADDVEDLHPQEFTPEREAVDDEDTAPSTQGMSWAELARHRANLARRTAEADDGAAHREDMVLRNSAAEWEVEDDTAYTPRRETGALWYVLFLLIGAALAAFGAWDTVQRATGAVEEAFVYGPAVAAAGVLFMAIAGWFLIKRVLSFR